VNHSSAFHNSLRNRKNKFASLSRLTWKEEHKEFVFLNWQPKSPPRHLLHGYIYIYIYSGVFSSDKINENMKWEIIAFLLLIAWPNGALWMVGILLHACTCVKSNLVAAFLTHEFICFAHPQLICMVAEWSILSMHVQAP
jgi:hypothetical protein